MRGSKVKMDLFNTSLFFAFSLSPGGSLFGSISFFTY